MRDALAASGIGVRAFPGDPTMSEGVRITCPGGERDFQRLTAALTAACRKEHWVFSASLDALMAARAAGQIPIALGDPDAPTAHDLMRAGVARVVERREDLEESFL